jgi:hypothetical protein
MTTSHLVEGGELVSTASATEFQGPERRRHRVFITRNTEYHLRDDVCVAVRDRKSLRWAEGHLALRRRLEGAVRVHPNGALIPVFTPPESGDALFFTYDAGGESRQLVTSRIEEIDRPQKVVVASYPPLFKKRKD